MPPRGEIWRWKTPLFFAFAATYLPFLALALFMTAFVPCAHCKQTAWMLAPVGPGLVPVHAVLKTFGLGRIGDGWEFACAGGVSLALVAGLVLLSRRGKAVCWCAAAVTFIACCFAAVMLFAVIRS
ncbi:MAG: hypothetical protein KF708_04820 [Pirellulales bacterium]|nr:hypothetical protein [Pirellulales bacterium]